VKPEGELLLPTSPRIEAMASKAPSGTATNALQGRREECSRFELDPHSSMSREVEDVEGGLYQCGDKRLRRTG
ncbi:jg20077, partial [Pararge aegeria aegeria]